MWMDRDDARKIALAKAETNDRLIRNPNAQKSQVVNAAAGALGDTAPVGQRPRQVPGAPIASLGSS